jgi:hypothetical protein
LTLQVFQHAQGSRFTEHLAAPAPRH